MPSRTGKCVNFGLCEKADSREIQTVAEGQEFICSNPRCGKPLQPTKASATTSVPVVPIIIGVGVFLIAGLAYFLLSKPSSSTNNAHVPGNVILTLSGSNTIGAELAPALAQEFLKQQLGATDVTVIPKGQDEVQVQGVLPGESSPKAIEIRAHGSATAFSDLAKEKCDIGMSSRKIKPAEITQLAVYGDMTAPASENVLGLDGIAVIVSQSNTKGSLTKSEIADIFSGQISDWSQVYGSPGHINVYARDEKSGTWDTFKSLVLGTGSLTSSAKRLEDSRELSDAVAADANGIGFIGLPYIRSAKALAISEKTTRALLPNALTVSTEDYVLSRRLFLYTPAAPKNDLTRKFVTFALSKSGQDVVQKTGFIGQNVEHVEPAPTPNLTGAEPAKYRELTAGAQRLSLNFRFRTGSSILDNKALVDLDRVVSFLSDLHYQSENVLLLGFADSTGTETANCVLSKNRAQVVASEFERRGVNAITVQGFCAEMPVASNDTPEGREKNRRVEIWVKK